MRLTGISMDRSSYGEYKGKFAGSLTFNDDYHNQIKLVLSEDKCDAILQLVAKQLIEQTQQIAGDMTERIIEATTGKQIGVDKA